MSRRRIFQVRQRRSRPVARLGALLVLSGWIAMGFWHAFKPLPEGLSVAAPLRPAPSVRFIADYTYVDAAGERHVEQRIFDRMLGHIARAEHLIVLDMFLFNDFAGQTGGDDMRPLSAEVASALIARKREHPGIRIILITDPINHLYGGLDNERFGRLRNAGIEVVNTDLGKLRDSNPAWSGLWRLCCQWFGNSGDGGWLPNPMSEQKVTLRSLLELLNFKANHRKTFVADAPAGWVGLVTSGNPHDASSAHSNIAVEFTGPAALDLLETERAVMVFSSELPAWPRPPGPAATFSEATGARLQVLTEGKIRDAVLVAMAHAGAGDAIDLAMFYLSHRSIVRELKAAHRRGASVRALLDPNEDAFGRKKSGIPNRQVAAELVAAGIDVRWCDTHGEQCHDKLVLVRYAAGDAELIAGSANLTRRNLDDLNLETDVRVAAPVGSAIVADALAYFERRWYNRPGMSHSVGYQQYVDDGWFKYWLYRFMEASGMSTF